MKLKKLELYGFKSFAQRTEIVFDEGITGIVGPNGSGKSNIGDAVRWVLGEQSAKTLRGASMSDVIFNGTQKRKPLSYCEVSLVFDNDDHALAMEAAEVMVTRRVYRNGESEYYLNRTACRLKDVVDLFRDTGIGKEGYSIIGQGRIDEILSRKSEDRRQVFEEAAGIVKFKARKEEADKKLQRTLENLERVDDILDELTKRLKPLEEQSRNARVYLELSTELKDLDLNLFLIRSDRARARLSELESELLTVQTILADTESNLTDKTTRRDETPDNIHSIFVDQWDWEKIITPKQRTMETLQATVRAIYLTLRKTEGFVCAHYPHIKPELPDDITFVSSQELEDLYPDLPPKEREYRAVREYGAVFLTGIGGALRSGQMHDGRAPDYDDYTSKHSAL